MYKLISNLVIGLCLFAAPLVASYDACESTLALFFGKNINPIYFSFFFCSFTTFTFFYFQASFLAQSK